MGRDGGRPEGLEEEDGGIEEAGGVEVGSRAWSLGPAPGECALCEGLAAVPRNVAASAAPAGGSFRRGGGELTRRPVTRTRSHPGSVLARLFGEHPVAGWLMPGRGWWPRPRRNGVNANAAWELHRCDRCGLHVAALSATVAIQAGAEILVDWNPAPECEDAMWPWEVTFDGGARNTGMGPMAGAGAVLWRHHIGGGEPSVEAKAVVAIPWDASAQVAEAHGCRAALRLLQLHAGGQKRARVVGDNLAVIRYGAGTAGMRVTPQQALLEVALAGVYTRGWDLDWQAVRRRLNTEADELATMGVHQAARCASQGVRHVQDYVIRTRHPGGPLARL